MFYKISVDGLWGNWMAWELCNVTCGTGSRVRRRLCDSPAPQLGGEPCQGEHIQSEECDMGPCSGKHYVAKLPVNSCGICVSLPINFRFFLVRILLAR